MIALNHVCRSLGFPWWFDIFLCKGHRATWLPGPVDGPNWICDKQKGRKMEDPHDFIVFLILSIGQMVFTVLFWAGNKKLKEIRSTFRMARENPMGVLLKMAGSNAIRMVTSVTSFLEWNLPWTPGISHLVSMLSPNLEGKGLQWQKHLTFLVNSWCVGSLHLWTKLLEW